MFTAVLAQSPTSSPDCLRLQDSEFATNPEFSIFYAVYEQYGFNTLLSNLKKPATLLLLNNEAVAEDLAAHNVTVAEYEQFPFFVAALEYHIIPDQAFLVSQHHNGIGDIRYHTDPTYCRLNK